MTPRQFDVIRLLALGRNEREVADALDISLNTVRSHRTSVYHEHDVSSLVDLLRLIGWLTVPEQRVASGDIPASGLQAFRPGAGTDPAPSTLRR